MLRLKQQKAQAAEQKAKEEAEAKVSFDFCQTCLIFCRCQMSGSTTHQKNPKKYKIKIIYLCF
jgi:hypothetical protein